MGIHGLYWLRRLRQNHAMEHATIHVLSQRFLNIHLLGRSDFRGFTLLGNVSTQDLFSAATEALSRLQQGEAGLAVHPHCGTNIATGALLAAASSWLAMGGRARSRLEKVPRLLMATMSALLVAQPLGFWAQEHITTTPDVSNLQIESVMRQNGDRVISHRVRLRHG